MLSRAAGVLLIGVSIVVTVPAGAGQYAKISDDMELYYEEAGRGRPIVFIPGWTGTTRFFDRQLPHFAKGYRAITYDPRGQGRSTRTIEHNDYIQHGVDLKRFIDALGLDDLAIVGWSNGCTTGYAYFRRFSTEHVRAFVCIDETPQQLGDGTPGEWVEGDARTLVNDFLIPLTADRRAFIGEFVKWMVKRDLARDELRWITDEMLKTPTSTALQLLVSGMIQDFRPEAKMLDGKIPVLNVVRREWADTARAWIETNVPQSDIYVFAGHMHFWADAATFNAALEDFLKKTR
jgi:non-heme chloroperoxidase